jgi:hypothetical protein
VGVPRSRARRSRYPAPEICRSLSFGYAMGARYAMNKGA